MKRVLVMLVIGMFSVALIGCHASVDTDTPNDGSSSHYKKTTTYDNGTKTTKTETTVNP